MRKLAHRLVMREGQAEGGAVEQALANGKVGVP
jgi:hypothetical protein